ncbi:hypothetical protein [Sideroxydans lithotrophicus]|uniref:Uncharacterized protein n=1 Tax=Sideroxydans lithotrophicus (strain ES-1) TaxID=580332 RepID=D5CT87_SIDLE|nr:hypothetical protein [Sideroxydans lithotrophicus]ADE12173.1 hypothetical protein Slit_1944 [Sideroxydans lithotrophicus ES-1]
MASKSKTVIRNAKRVGNNSRSYDEKHPENPISLRPIADVKKFCFKTDSKGFVYLDRKKWNSLLMLGTFAKPDVMENRFRIAQAK